jgi:hypothetical protein
MTRQETTTGQIEMTAAAQASTRNRRDPAGGRVMLRVAGPAC